MATATARSYIVAEASDTQWKAIDAISSKGLQLFFRNISYLKEKNGYSGRKFRTAIAEKTGIKVGRDSVRFYCEGRYKAASTRYLGAYCLFFGEDLGRLMSVDYRAEGL